MSAMSFSERVNEVSNLISRISADPGERLGITATLFEIYRANLQSYLAPATIGQAQNEGENGK